MIAGRMPGDILIIGLDPGKTVGFAVLDHGAFHLRDLPYQEAVDELSARVHNAQACDQPFIISCERYVQRHNRPMTRQNDALELIGVARYLARRCGALSFMLNDVSDAQRVGNPALLRRLRWWHPGGDHLNKAASQVVYAVSKLYPEEYAHLVGV